MAADAAQQAERFKAGGFPNATGLDLGQVQAALPAADMARSGDGALDVIHSLTGAWGYVCRAFRLEFMDEYEEWNLFNRHYSVVTASKGSLLHEVTFR